MDAPHFVVLSFICGARAAQDALALALVESCAAPGKEMGVVLKSLQAKWIRAGFPRDPVAVKSLLDDAMANAY